jgi:polyribonucleotide nucleotidyltransferase
MKEIILSKNWLGRELTISSGKLAKQADSAVTVQYGDTVVLATVVESKEARENTDFFPLMVEFEEKLYAAGIIKGSQWIKREGRPSDESVLTGRMIDRSIRPLFDDESRKDIQVMLSVLSVDQENDHDIIALIAASAALAITKIKWQGPIGGVRVGRTDGKLVFNPNYEQRKLSDLDLIVAGTKEKTIMIEASANEVSDDDMAEAILAGQKELEKVVEIIAEFKSKFPQDELKEIKSKPQDPEDAEKKALREQALAKAEAWLKENIKNILFDKQYYTKAERKASAKAIKDGLDQYLFEQGYLKDIRSLVISELAEKMIEAEVTRAIIEEKKRVDGRQLTEIRTLIAEVALWPRTHGSGLFSRGETQVMSIVTLGAPGLEQSLEGVEGFSTKRYMHHYNFPPFSVGEAKPLRSLGRREIGHGALAEKALAPMIPDKDVFPYTIRVVSETLGSNGSSSMASTCGSTLALMDAGVPIKKPVAGIAMGLASNADMSKWEILTDIQDLEDSLGGMDFKITGTDTGITAIQLDTKTLGLNEEIIRKTVKQARPALDQILGVLKTAIATPRAEVSKYAPKITSFSINPEKIGMVIGGSGKTIKKLTEEFDVTIDIEDDGSVFISGTDLEKIKQAEVRVKEIAHDFLPGQIYTGSVVRILDFGIFVRLTENQDGMAHVSELAPYRVSRPENFVKLGDIVTVKIKEIDDQGRINLTLKGMPENDKLWAEEKGKDNGNGGSRSTFDARPERRSDDRRRRF